MTIAHLVAVLRAVQDLPHPEGPFEPRILSAAIAAQGRDLHVAWQHAVPTDALARRIGELLCDLVTFADVLAIDAEGAVRQHLERFAVTAGRLAKPALRTGA
jgi:hypothetical protein